MKSFRTMIWILGGLLLGALVLDLSGIMGPATGDASFLLGSAITLFFFLGGAALVRFAFARRRLSLAWTWLIIVILYFVFFIVRAGISEEEYRPSLLFLLSVLAAFRISRSESSATSLPKLSEGKTKSSHGRDEESDKEMAVVSATASAASPAFGQVPQPAIEQHRIYVQKPEPGFNFVERMRPLIGLVVLVALAAVYEGLIPNSGFKISGFGVLVGGTVCGTTLRFIYSACRRFEESQYGPGIASVIYGVVGVGVIIALNQFREAGLNLGDIVLFKEGDATLGFIAAAMLGVGLVGGNFDPRLGRRGLRIVWGVTALTMAPLVVVLGLHFRKERNTTQVKELAKPEWRVVKIEGREYISDENVAEFYQFSELAENGSIRAFKHPNLVMVWMIGAPFVDINGVRVSLEHPIVEYKGRAMLSTLDLAMLVEPIIRPGSVAGRTDFTTVVLDPKKDGDSTNSRDEDDTLALALELEGLLAASGFRVVLTRRDGADFTNRERLAVASRETNAIYVALLSLVDGNTEKGGIHAVALVQPESTPEERNTTLYRARFHDLRSVSLAMAIHSHSLAALKTEDSGISRVEIEEFAKIGMPSVLVELSSFPLKDERAIESETVSRHRLAVAIVDGIEAFRKASSGNPVDSP